jgi:hypothetical protein
MNNKNNQRIKRLTPAAARLLLSMLSAHASEPYTEIVARSGIAECQTLASARTQLEENGFILRGPDGKETASLVDLRSTYTPVRRGSVITDAYMPPYQTNTK